MDKIDLLSIKDSPQVSMLHQAQVMTAKKKINSPAGSQKGYYNI